MGTLFNKLLFIPLTVFLNPVGVFEPNSKSPFGSSLPQKLTVPSFLILRGRPTETIPGILVVPDLNPSVAGL